MKIKFSTLVAGLLLGALCIVTSCARVDELDNRVTDLEKKLEDVNKQLPSIQDQIKILTDFKTQIETSLPQSIKKLEDDLKALETNLGGKIDGVDQKYADLVAQLTGQLTETLNAIQGQIDALEAGKVSNGDFEAYKEELESTLSMFIQIFELSGLVDFEQGYVYDPFEYTEYVYDILIGYISDLAEALNALETTVSTDYVTKTFIEQLKEQATAEAKAFAAKMQEDSTTFATEIAALKTAKDELWTAVNGVIDRITPLEGRVDELERIIGVLPEDVTSFSKAVSDHQAAIDDLLARVAVLEGKVSDVEDLLKNRIQSLVFVPEYNDLALTFNISALKAVRPDVNSPAKMRAYTEDILLFGEGSILSVNKYRVKPAELADSIVCAFKAEQIDVTFDNVIVKARGEITKPLKLKVRDITADKGVLSVVTTVEDTITTGSIALNTAALVLSDFKGNSRTTEYALCKGVENIVKFKPAPKESEAVTTVHMQYNDNTPADFFKPTDTAFQPLFALGEEDYTPKALKEKNGIDVAPYIISKLDSTNCDPTNAVVCATINKEDAYFVANLSADKTKNVAFVGDTLKLYKSYGIRTVGEDVDTLCWADPFVGYFVVDPLTLTADLSAEVVWNFTEDVTGDRAENNNKFLYKNKNIPVTIKTQTLDKSAYTLADLSHKAPVEGTIVVKKEVDGETVNVTGTELANFKCAPSMNKTAGTLALDSLSGFNFEAKKYIVEAKYALGEDGAEHPDTLATTLTINLTDRDRSIISHKFAPVKINVGNEFGGELHYVLHGKVENQYDGVYDYFADAITQYPKGSTKAEDFATWWNWTSVRSAIDGGDIVWAEGKTIQKKDSIIVCVPYDIYDVLNVTDISHISLKDTVITGYGQKVALEFPLEFVYPEFQFKHSDYFVAQDEDGTYYSTVKPNYQGYDENWTWGYNEKKPAWFGVYDIDLSQNFTIIDAEGKQLTNQKMLDTLLTVKYNIVEEDLMSNLWYNYAFDNWKVDGRPIIDNHMLSYQDDVPYITVRADVRKWILTNEAGPVALKYPNEFDEGGKYATYQIRKFEPFESFTSTPVIQKVNEVKTYSVNILKGCKLKDVRGYDLLDENGDWVVGNEYTDHRNNGFANGKPANSVYNIWTGTEFEIEDIPVELQNKITVDENNGIIYFNYTGQEYLVKDIVIKAKVKIKTTWSTWETETSVTFQKEK